MTTAIQVKDRTTTYAEDVTSGELVAGRLVRLACERHLRDLDQGADRGLVWDVDAADHALEFISFLGLFEGKFADQPFILQPWEAFIAAERQVRTCYAMEIEPRYVDMAIARWEQYTGGKVEVQE